MTARTLRRILLLFALANLLILGGRCACPRQAGELRVTFLDVGQGDAAVIETPAGKTLLVDTGGITASGDDEGRRVVAPFLQSRGIQRIDAILLSHPHADHIGGAATLMERFPVSLLMDNGQEFASPIVTRVLEAAKAHDVAYKAARRGQEMECGDGVRLRVLAPSEEAKRGTPNDASIVLRLEYGRTIFLFTGDAEAGEEEELVRSGQTLACDVLKAGHHGSHTSTTPLFLAAARPRIAIISCGAHNLYGHPSASVIDRLRAAGAQVYRTDKNGAVTCTSDGIRIRTETMHP